MLIRATLLAVLLSLPASAQTLLRLSTAAPPADFLAKACETFKVEVEKAAPSMKVEVHPASALFRQGTEVPALQRGTLEMSTMTTFEVAQQIPEYGFFNRAFLLRDFAHAQKVFEGPIGVEYRKAVAEKMGIEILSMAYLGTRQVGLKTKRAVAGPNDLKGLKLRMPAGPEWLLLGQSLGVSPVPMGMPEVYLALKTGAIDGQENPLSIFSAAKLYEVSEQVVLTAHLVQPVFFSVAKPYFDKLTAAQQAAVRAAAVTAAEANNTGRLADEASIADAMKARNVSVDKIDLALFRAQADAVYATADLAKAWDKALMAKVVETK